MHSFAMHRVAHILHTHYLKIYVCVREMSQTENKLDLKKIYSF